MTPTQIAGAVCVVAAGSWLLIRGLLLLSQHADINLADLTVEDEPADATVSDVLDRIERYIPIPYSTDPRHRLIAQDYRDVAVIREQRRWDR